MGRNQKNQNGKVPVPLGPFSNQLGFAVQETASFSEEGSDGILSRSQSWFFLTSEHCSRGGHILMDMKLT